ncbi:MAG: ZIP family metal transporter [Gemmatimonadetes bacterium]|nr:ZIP family metal transporter [Gemmatimonadota bacterium]
MNDPATVGWLSVTAFALIAGLAGLIGVWLMWRHEEWARRHTAELITFASGLLVAGSLLHLLAHASEMTGPTTAMMWALVAFVALYVSENHFLPHPHARVEEDCGHHHAHTADGFGWTAILGLGIHSVLEGIAVGAGFTLSYVTGAVIVSLVVAHKLPVGIASMGVLYHGGVDRGRAVRVSASLAFITPAAVLISYAAFRGASEGVLGPIVAAAGGSFLYVGAADLLPEGQASAPGRNTIAFILGLVVMVAAYVFVPHDVI